MYPSLKRFGFLLQLCLLAFGITAHALALDPSAGLPETLYQRIAGDAQAEPLAIADSPDIFKRADFPQANTKIAEAGPYEKEEEEEVSSGGVSFKFLTHSGSGTSAFFCTLATLAAGGDHDRLSGARYAPVTRTLTRRHVLYQVYRI